MINFLRICTRLCIITLLILNGISNNTPLPPCRACKQFAVSFINLFDKIKTINDSPENKLQKIEENLCDDWMRYQDQCWTLYELHQSSIENWLHENVNSDFYKFLCIETAKDCCSENHYGSNCTPCPGYPDKICSGNGKCKGEGTRKGNGKCSCDVGYTGEMCNECAPHYYEAYRDKNKLLCAQCHQACLGQCTSGGPKGCQKCKSSWLTTENGCVDINECATSKNACQRNQFCVNTEGSFKCLKCDHSCRSCTGDGPDMCVHCAEGYIKQDNMCIDGEMENRRRHGSLTRYLTYFGLCLATCIIFKKNTIVAAVIGIAVAIYISASEYILNTPPTPILDDLAQQLQKRTEFLVQ